MPVHRTPEQLAEAMDADVRVILNAARELDVPVFEGRIDSVLFAEALVAADHHLAPAASGFLPEGG